ncbi:hypothetical protein BAE44_0019036 [Dichanthelium oligosanthes]|uniref:Late embryogenesis abundant protein LEA-2 subgroup domain-containing protein n=1 Tax=Dichanthelium oligosanthes TaxID=888268 RepID=A0A1E5V4N5_9POAL|nr:hypothetical protein BAE44_0019036 [Dichanthelium oligosanthes]
MASTHKKDDGCGCFSWMLATILDNGFFILLTLLPSMRSLAYPDVKITTCSVELAGFQGLQPALSPEVTSPAFDLIVRITNGHTFSLRHSGGDVVVSYAGVPLAHGRTLSFELGDKDVLALPVEATSAGVDIPGYLFRLMTDERRWGIPSMAFTGQELLAALICAARVHPPATKDQIVQNLPRCQHVRIIVISTD